jgi:E3 ubiquitin-protein ligase UBR4
MLRTLKIYYNTENVTDLTTFKDKWDRWTLAKSLALAPGQKEIKITLAIPIIAINLLVSYSDFYEAADANETLKCPRCNTFVQTKHGICPSCRENVYQCRQCRHINYEKLGMYIAHFNKHKPKQFTLLLAVCFAMDHSVVYVFVYGVSIIEGFLCPECGYSRFGTFTYHLNAKPSYVISPVTNEAERRAAMHTISVQNELLETAATSLESTKRQMLHLFDELERKRPPLTSHSFASAAAATSAAAANASSTSSVSARETARQQAMAQALQQQQAAAAAAGGSTVLDTIRPLNVRRSPPLETVTPICD